MRENCRSNKDYRLVFIALMLIAAIPSSVFAQISVNQASTTQQVENLVEDVLLGSCVTVSNVNYIGPASASGTFNSNGTAFPMGDGILLTTGRANIAIGPDNDNDAGVDQGNSGDADLTDLVTGAVTYDAVILEFDFVPQDDTLRFDYIFASEEYPEWVNSGYNDVFGFFISGPGFSGPYAGGAENIALIPGTTTPVAINNVNNGYSATEPATGPCTNCAYYNENGGGADVQYDGFTTILTAEAVVQPCQSYHIRLAIADAGDHIYDSGVFLEAGSFSAGGGISVDVTTDEVHEGCSDAYFVFHRVDLSDNSSPVSATYTIGGTATMGVDYSGFPLSVTIPAGQDSVLVQVDVPLDFTVEGVETIIVYLDQPPCSCLAPGFSQINVIDNDTPLALTTTGETTICLGQSTNLTASVGGSLPPYTGSWDSGAPAGANVSVSPANTTTYTYTVTDQCGTQTETSTETVTVIRPDLNVVSADMQCLNGNSFSFQNQGASGALITHEWTFGDGNSSSDENPNHTYAAAGIYTITHIVTYNPTGCTTSATTTVTVWEHPSVSISTASDISCNGGSDGALDANVSGGQAGYIYSWSPGGETTASISGLSTGNYSVVVTDANGCTGSDADFLEQPGPVTASCSSTSALCFGEATGTATVVAGGGTAGYTYLWSDGQATATATGLAAGPYSVTVTDANGCTETCSTSVGQPTAALSATCSSTDALCNGQATGSVSVSASGGTAGYSYLWSTGDTTTSVTGLAAGTYSVTVTDANGCTTTCSATVGEPSAPISLTCSGTDALCHGEATGSVSVSASGGIAGYSYSWSTGATTASVSGLAAGTYSVTVTDANGCTETCSYTVGEPSAPLSLTCSGTDALCHGESTGSVSVSASGGTTGYSYSWSNESSDASQTGLPAGTYTVTVTDANGCTETCSHTVGEPAAPLAASCTSTPADCNGASTGSASVAVSGGTAGYTYLWSTGETTATIAGLASGSYSITVTDANGCTATCSTFVEEPTALDLTCSATDALCNNDPSGSVSVSVSGGTPGYSYSWTNGSTDASQTGLLAGTYGVTLTDANGCMATCSSIIGQPDQLVVVVDVQDETLVNGCNGSATANPTGGTGPYTYSWSDGQTTQTASNLCSGIYEVTVVDANGCEVSTSIVINPPTCDLDVTLDGTDVNCNAGSDGTVTATPVTNQNNTPFTYLWNNGETTQTISGVTAGPYSVVVTDSIGCEASGSFVVSEPTLLTISTSVVDEQTFNGCDGSATVTASGGTAPYTYLWNDPAAQTTATASNLCPGTYTVTVTDANGCAETATITVNPLLCTGYSVAVNVTGLTCFETGDGTATAVVTGGTAPFTYSWDNGGTAPTITGLSAGTYTVTVTDAVNCVQIVSGSVTQPALLEAATAADNVTCHGAGNGVIELTVTGGTTPYSFNWSNGETVEDLTNLEPGTYSVDITDANGCTTDAIAVITEPDTMNASSVDEFVHCSSGSNGSIDLTVEGGLGPYLVSWSNDENTEDLSGLPAGTYTATIVDQNGCIYEYTTTITEPNLLVATCSSENALCNNDPSGSVSVSVSGGTAPYTYAWTNGSTDASQTGLLAGTYGVTVTDANGCIANCTAVIDHPDQLVVVVDVVDETIVNGCNGSATANPTGGTGPYTYLWSDGQTTQTATGLCAGIYEVTVTDANGCEVTTSIVINPPSCDLDVTVDGTDVNCNAGSDGTVTATPITNQNNTPFTYLWNNGMTTQTIFGVTAGPYSVVVTDSIGCTASGSFVISEPTPLSVSTTVIDEQTFNGCDGSATAIVSGGTGPYTYQWDDPAAQTTATASNLCPGTYTVVVTDANGCTETVTVTVNPLLCTGYSVAVNTTGLSCFEAGDGTATAVVTGGTPPFAHLWSNGETTPTITGLSAGTYTVTVTDAVECVQIVSGNVTQTALLEAATAVDNVSCFGASNGIIELTVTGGTTPYTFAWSNGSSDEDLTGLGPGSYTVDITDANGCATSAMAVVTEPDTMNASSVNVDVTCFEGNDGSIDLTVTGGLGPYLVSWDNGMTGEDISGLSAGTYVATIVDQNGCIYTYSTTIIEADLFVPQVTASGPLDFCRLDSVILTATGGTSYLWNNGDTTQSIMIDMSGTWWVEVTNEDGCLGVSVPVTTIMYDLPNPFITPDGPTEFCEGGSVTLSSNPWAQYVWSPNGEVTQSITVTTSGTYSVYVVDDNGCEATSDGVTVTVNPNPEPTISADGPTQFCDVESVTLTASLADAYLWSPNGEVTQSITVNISGSYSVTVTDENGCVGASDATVITVYDNPDPVVVASGTTEFCDGDSITLTVNEFDQYLWTPNGEMTQSITVTESGDYSVLVTDENGCTAASQPIAVTVYQIEPATVTANGPTEFCEGGQVDLTASAGDSYSWMPNGEVTQTIAVSASGTYSVTVVDANGCSSASDSVEVVVNPNPTPQITVNGQSTICEGDSTILVASGGGSYVWNPNGEMTESITVWVEGTYSVLATDSNGCSATSEGQVVNVFEETPIEIIPNGPTEFCAGEEVTLTATTGQSYLWMPNGEVTQSITVSQPGSYSVVVEDSNGCSYGSGDEEVTVFELPSVDVLVDGPLEFCEGEQVDLIAVSATAISYQWAENGTGIGGATDSSLTVGNMSTYSVTVTDDNGCSGSASAPILIIGPAPTADLGADVWMCPDGSIELFATGGDHYLWSNGSTDQSIVVSAESTDEYSVIVTNDNCGLTAFDTIMVNIYPTPEAGIEVQQLGFLEHSVEFSDASEDSSIVSWYWDFGDGEYDEEQNPSHSFGSEEEFMVILTVENEHGCIDMDTAFIEIQQVIEIPDVFTPNNDGYNDQLLIENSGVTEYEFTVYNRWGIIMHHDETGEVFWDGRTPAGVEAESGTYFYILNIQNSHSFTDYEDKLVTGHVTLIR